MTVLSVGPHVALYHAHDCVTWAAALEHRSREELLASGFRLGWYLDGPTDYYGVRVMGVG